MTDPSEEKESRRQDKKSPGGKGDRERLDEARENLKRIQQTLAPFTNEKGAFSAESQEGEPKNATLN